jgi:antitoxin (DNA-binding transcriptional repressor) of toxin-antitoxin stability system
MNRLIKIDMHEAKTQLSQLAERAWSGDTVIICKAGKPYLDLLPHRKALVPRKPGRLKGVLNVPADFDEVSEQTISDFEPRL